MLSNLDDLPLMGTPTLEGLPMDVHDHLLCMLPDEETLKAAVLSCKAFHEAYKSRKESIDKEVLDNRKAFEQLIMHRDILLNLLSAVDALRRFCMRDPDTERAGAEDEIESGSRAIEGSRDEEMSFERI